MRRDEDAPEGLRLLSDAAWKCLVVAQDEAEHQGAPFIGLRHLFLGLTAPEPATRSRTVFDRVSSKNTDWFREVLFRGVYVGLPPGPRAYTSEATAGLARAFDLGQGSADQYVSTAHILLGLLSNPGDPAGDFRYMTSSVGGPVDQWHGLATDVLLEPGFETDSGPSVRFDAMTSSGQAESSRSFLSYFDRSRSRFLKRS